MINYGYICRYGFATDNSAMITLPQGAKVSPKGLATGTLTALLGNGGGRATSGDGISGYLLSTNFYDAEERLIETRSQTPGGGLLTATTAYTVGGVPVRTRTRLTQGDTQLTYTNDITVDRHGRPVTSVLTRGDSGPSWTLAACTYDGIGRLSSVTAGGTLTRTTTYDIHGWMKSWRTPYLSQSLSYGESSQSNSSPSYTGLITAKSTQSGGQSSTYSYSYDRLGRLTSAVFSGGLPGQDFSTTYAYDLQGNMLRLTRKGLTAPREYGLIDDITATYTGNQLRILYDEAPQVLLEASMDVPEGEHRTFEYDANGNMTCDMSRDIADMEYNALNLPCRVTFAGGAHIDWLYSASGQKLRQTVISVRGDTLSRRDYLGPYLFTDNEFDRYETAEGYITPDDIYHAYVPDYQGNIVGVYNTSTLTPEQTTDYYPYGLPFADASNPTANRRKYGAKELTPDLGLNAYDFEARTLVPAFPMFIQQDPMAEKYYPLSPYLYCAGNPICYIDPDGMDIYSLNIDGKFSLISKTDDDFDIIYGSGNEASIQVSKSFFQSKKSFSVDVNGETFKGYRYKLDNVENADVLYKFLIQNSNVEWSRLIFDNKEVHLSNSGDEGADAYIGIVLAYQQDLIGGLMIFDHSHTNGHLYPSSADLDTVKKISQLNDNVVTRIFNDKMEYFEYDQYTPEDETFNDLEVISNAPQKKKLIPCKSYRDFIPKIIK